MSNYLFWSVSPTFSNWTISTSRSGAAADSGRAMPSVWASAITLLRVPIRNETATTEAPSDNRARDRATSFGEIKTSRRRNANGCPWALKGCNASLRQAVRDKEADHHQQQQRQ